MITNNYAQGSFYLGSIKINMLVKYRNGIRKDLIIKVPIKSKSKSAYFCQTFFSEIDIIPNLFPSVKF